jgi:integrase
MSVYKRRGADTYTYDFEAAGSRFSGDTGETSKRKALAVQDLRRAEAKAAAKTARRGADRNMTVGEAFALYMLQVGLFQVNSGTTLKDLERLEARLGKHRRFCELTDADVAEQVALRRVDPRRVGKADDRGKQRPVSNATVNRSCVEPLRKVHLRARKVWKLPVEEIDWSQHMLSEPRERVREASGAEQAQITAELGRGYDEALEFDFIYGLRVMELVGLTWNRVDFFGRKFTVIGKGKRQRTIPMTERAFQILWAQRGRNDVLVFTYEAKRTDRRKQLIRGLRYPLTKIGFTVAMRRAIARAGVPNFRPTHDVRHTAATRVLRRSNIKVVKELLGHADIATTDRYAHALQDDILAGLEAVAVTESPIQSPSDESGRADKELGSLGKIA